MIMTNLECRVIEIILKNKITTYKKKNNDKYSYRSDEFSIVKPNKIDLSNAYLYIHWYTGGISGGSCWNDGTVDNHYYRKSDDQEPEFDELDIILENICPNITYLQYKRLTNGLMLTGNYSFDEYYGNSSEYSWKAINLQELCNRLTELVIECLK